MLEMRPNLQAHTVSDNAIARLLCMEPHIADQLPDLLVMALDLLCKILGRLGHDGQSNRIELFLDGRQHHRSIDLPVEKAHDIRWCAGRREITEPAGGGFVSWYGFGDRG